MALPHRPHLRALQLRRLAQGTLFRKAGTWSPPQKKKKELSDYDGLIALLLLLFSPLIALAVAALANLFGIESPYPALTGWIVAYAFSIGFVISGSGSRKVAHRWRQSLPSFSSFSVRSSSYCLY